MAELKDPGRYGSYIATPKVAFNRRTVGRFSTADLSGWWWQYAGRQAGYYPGLRRIRRAVEDELRRRGEPLPEQRAWHWASANPGCSQWEHLKRVTVHPALAYYRERRAGRLALRQPS